MKKVGFLINPIAGMGGRVGLKGTDNVVHQAMQMGAQPTAQLRAARTLGRLHDFLRQSSDQTELHWLTCSGEMGANCLTAAGYSKVEQCYEPQPPTTQDDTIAATGVFMNLGAELILFCGGDGTARDVCSVTRHRIPILGIPAGVKMYSGVFGTSPSRTAEILYDWLQEKLTTASVEILDLDEDRYRQGEWVVRLCDTALTPFELSFTQSTKILITGQDESSAKKEIADYLAPLITAAPDKLFLLGPGSTVATIARRFDIDNTLLGVDAILAGKQIGKDLNEQQILSLLENHSDYRLVLSPIGAQGFILGRGNQQLSPTVIKKIRINNIIIVATPAKLARTAVLRFDTGDSELDTEFAEKTYLPVVIGHRLRRLVKVLV